MSVVVIGDVNVDLEIRLPERSGPRNHANPEPQLFGGGSAANTAAALARLGIDCRFVGTVGDDVFGRFATATLAEAGVNTESVVMTAEAPTVMVIAAVEPDGERMIYVWPPRGGAHSYLAVEDAVAAVAGATWLHVSGICLRVAPARDAVLAAMEEAQAGNTPVSFDLNLRLENWGWDDGFRAVVEAAVVRSDVILGAAHDEIVPLAGGADDPVAAAVALAGDGRLVIARLGAAGATACSAESVLSVPAFAVEAVDTTGAGDAFNAGFIAARTVTRDAVEALRWGNAVAALAITQPGARATPTVEEVEALLAQ